MVHYNFDYDINLRSFFFFWSLLYDARVAARKHHDTVLVPARPSEGEVQAGFLQTQLLLVIVIFLKPDLYRRVPSQD